MINEQSYQTNHKNDKCFILHAINILQLKKSKTPIIHQINDAITQFIRNIILVV